MMRPVWIPYAMLLCFLPLPLWAQEMPSPIAGVLDQTKTEEATNSTLAGIESVVMHVEKKPMTSLFLSDTDIEMITMARDQYGGRSVPATDDHDLLDDLANIKLSKQPEEDLQEKFYVQFYLESLLYHTPTDWMIWLKDSDSGRKFTPNTMTAADIGIKVVSINKEDVTFEWTPKRWLQISNAYKGDSRNIVLDQMKRVVFFTLRVNQTLSTSDMQVKEGAVAPVAFVADDGTMAPGAAPKTLPVAPGADKNAQINEPGTAGKPAAEKNKTASDKQGGLF